MPEINWSLGQTDPIGQQARAYSYADKIRVNAAQSKAGQLYAGGDRGGAAKVLAGAGDIQGAQGIEQQQEHAQDRQQKSAEAAYQYIGQALPVFERVAEQHAGDPDGGAAALGQAFDQLAPEIAQATGHPPEALAQFKQGLMTDPKGTITRVGGMLPVKYQTVGHQIVRQQGNNVTPVYTGQRDAPAGYEYGPDGKTLQFIKNGPQDPEVIKRNATERREVIINNPIPGQSSGGESVSLSPEGLTNQVDTYIASRGAIMPSFGYGKQGKADRDRFYNQLAASMKEHDITANDIASGRAEYKANASALGQVSKMRNSVESYEQTVQKNIGILESFLSGKGAPQGKMPVINRWIQAGRRSIAGDPDVSAYDTALKTVTAEYAKVMSGGTGSAAASTDSARAEAESLLNGAQTPAQVRAVLGTMKREMANRIESLKAQETDLKSRLGNSGKPAGGSDLKSKYGLE